MQHIPVTTIDFLHLGMDMMGVRYQKSNQSRNDLRFVALYGIKPQICSIVWKMLHTKWTKYVNNPKAVHLLWALRFMKGYSSWEMHAAELKKIQRQYESGFGSTSRGLLILFQWW